MIHERRWAGSRTYHIGNETYDTLEEALASLDLLLTPNFLKSPWHQVKRRPDINACIKEIRDQEVYLRSLGREQCEPCTGITQDEEGVYHICRHRTSSLIDALRFVGLDLMGVYLVMGSRRVKLPDLHVSTISHAWSQLADLTPKECPDLHDHILKLSRVI